MTLCKFKSDRKGSTATTFALAIIPLTFFVGASVDYARLLNYSTKLKNASDSAALAAALITSDPANPYSTNLSALRLAAAQATFSANIASEPQISGLSLALADIPNGVAVSATGSATNFFGGVLGNKVSNLAARSEASTSLANNKMEVAFVLDNTGSMAQLNKMPLLKSSMQKFLSKLQSGLNASTDVKVALVPFDTKVKIDPVFASGKPWMRQSMTDLSDWSGCIMDRVQPYDTNATTPGLAIPNTLLDAVDNNLTVFPTASPASCALPQMMPLTTNFSSFNAAVNAMSPNGTTNGTIGLAWGLQMLTPGDPYGAAAAFGGGVRKIIIFLTDGANTQNRWTNVATDIDARMLMVCNEIRNKGVELFTIGLVSANMSVLTPCASNPAKSFQVTDPTKIPDLFDLISQKLVSVRLSK